MTRTPRRIAVEILNRVEDEGAFAEPLLDTYLSRSPKTKAQDKGLLTQIIYGTIRTRGRLDWIIETLYQGEFASMDTGIKNILRAGIFQLLFMDRIPGFAAVDEAVKTAKKLHPAAARLVNAVLRNFIRRKDAIPYPDKEEDPALYISIYHSHPLWLVTKWIEMFGVEETEAFCKANNQIPPLAVRVNMLKTTRNRIEEEFVQSGFEVSKTEFSPDGLIVSNPPMPVRYTDLYNTGMIQIQDEGSQLIGHLVSPRRGEDILDVCAGVGGKTTHMAALMENQGRILALDISDRKLDALKNNAARMGAAIVETKCGDAREALKKNLPKKFDRILVDAPCSGLGTLRRNPEIKWRITPREVDECSSLQKAILENMAAYLNKGGILVYSTCTVTTQENDEVVRDFINRHPDFICVHPPDAIDSRVVDDLGYFRSYPHRHGTDAFFGAVLAIGTERRKI